MRRRLMFSTTGLVLLIALGTLGGGARAATSGKTRGYRWTIEGEGAVNISFGYKEGALRNGLYLASWNWKATGVVVYEEVRNFPNLDGTGQRFEMSIAENSSVTRPDFSDLTHKRRVPLCTDLGVESGGTKDTDYESEKYKGTAMDLTRGRLRWDGPEKVRYYQFKCKPADYMGLQGPFHYDIPAPSRKNFRTGTEFHKTLNQVLFHEFGESHPGANTEPHSFSGYNKLTVTFEHLG